MKSIIALLMLMFSSTSKHEGWMDPKFQWKVVDFAWRSKADKEFALSSGDYVPHNNMPVGLARWKDKLFITIPRWKKGVPATLNYINVNGPRTQLLNPYPNWDDGFVGDSRPLIMSNATVVSTFRVHVDKCDRLWVVDNGETEMACKPNQVSQPSLVVFDLWTDTVFHRHVLNESVTREASLFTSLVVDVVEGTNCSEAYAYMTDMGTNALVVYSLQHDSSWRLEHPHFYYDPRAGTYRVGGIDFSWNDGISSVALSKPKKNGYPDLFLHPTSSTKLFKITTKLLRVKNPSQKELNNGVQVVGDRGSKSQVTASDYDPETNALFYALVSKSAIGCWNVDRPFLKLFAPILLRDIDLLEFPNDVKVDSEGNVWFLSDRQSRFLYNAMNFHQVTFRYPPPYQPIYRV